MGAGRLRSSEAARMTWGWQCISNQLHKANES